MLGFFRSLRCSHKDGDASCFESRVYASLCPDLALSPKWQTTDLSIHSASIGMLSQYLFRIEIVVSQKYIASGLREVCIPLLYNVLAEIELDRKFDD